MTPVPSLVLAPVLRAIGDAFWTLGAESAATRCWSRAYGYDVDADYWCAAWGVEAGEWPR